MNKLAQHSPARAYEAEPVCRTAKHGTGASAEPGALIIQAIAAGETILAQQ
jgi:hypothetical protein